MTYSTTYYFENRSAARQFAKSVPGGAILTDSEGYSGPGRAPGAYVSGEAAQVLVFHGGGPDGNRMNKLAQQAAADFGEPTVLRVTVQNLTWRLLQAKDYEEEA